MTRMSVEKIRLQKLGLGHVVDKKNSGTSSHGVRRRQHMTAQTMTQRTSCQKCYRMKFSDGYCWQGAGLMPRKEQLSWRARGIS